MSIIAINSRSASSIHTIHIADIALHENIILYLGGFVKNWPNPITNHYGSISTLQGDDGMAVANIDTAKGMSGGPYLTPDRLVVGVHAGGLEYTAAFAHFVTVSAMHQQLNDYILLSAPPPTSNLEPDNGQQGPVESCGEPAINDLGEIDLRCNGLALEATKSLSKSLTQQFSASINDAMRAGKTRFEIQDFLRQDKSLKAAINTWLGRYIDITFRQNNATSESSDERLAQKLIQKGNLQAASKLLSKLAASPMPPVQAAATQLDLGDIAALSFDPNAALMNYGEACRLDPNNVLYATRYALLAMQERRLSEAETGWKKVLDLYRSLEGGEPGLHGREVAWALNNLGGVYQKMLRLNDAESQFKSAIVYYNNAHSRDPAVYSADIAFTLNNLGSVYLDKHQPDKAAVAFDQALARYEALRAASPNSHSSDFALTLNNLGGALMLTPHYADAGKFFDLALRTYKRLDESYSNTFQSEIGWTLNLQGGWYLRVGGHDTDAQHSYEQALAIYNILQKRDPLRYDPDVAWTMNNFGYYFRITKKTPDSLKLFQSALSIYERLYADQGHALACELAKTLNNEGMALFDSGLTSQAEWTFNQALFVYETMPNDGVATGCGSGIAWTEQNVGFLHIDSGRYKEAVQELSRAVSLYRDLVATVSDSYSSDLAWSLVLLGRAFYKVENAKQALAILNESKSIYTRLTTNRTDAFAWERNQLDETLRHIAASEQ